MSKSFSANSQGRYTDGHMQSTNTGGEMVLCLTTYEKGQALLRELARLGCRVVLLTVEGLRDADWPRKILEELHTMPAGLTQRQIVNTVAYLSRSRRFSRVIALDEFDMETAAALREHLRISGMGLTTTQNFRDKLAMRMGAAHLGIRVPPFTAVFNYDDLRSFMESVSAPWLLKPRSEASAIGIRKLRDAEQVWRALDELGDRQSSFLLEQFVPGDIFHVDGITAERNIMFAAAHQCGQPPMQVMHEGGVFTTRAVERHSPADREMKRIHAELVRGLGLVRGITHTEFIRSHATGEFYFLEIAARVGGAFIAEVVEQTYGINLWAEWARLEVAAMRGETYSLPPLRDDYAGSVLCLARVPKPDTSHYDAPEVVYRMQQHHHAGLIVRSANPARVAELLTDYSQRFLDEFCASQPLPDKPTA